MRKSLHIAKALTPVLTEEAANHIAEEDSRLRSQEQLGSDVAISEKMHFNFMLISTFYLFLNIYLIYLQRVWTSL